jgi:hypothetical protein
MCVATNPYYSIADVQGLADYVQFRLFATVAGATNEATRYDLRLQEFIGKLTTLQFIPAAVEYWGDQLLSQSTTGTSEVVTYGDRRADLWKVFDRLQTQVQAEWNSMAGTYGFQVLASRKLVPKVSYYDNGRGVLKTVDPQCFPPLFRSGLTESLIPWGLPEPSDVAS